MFVLRPHCAGLDIHKKTVSVCRIRTDAQGHLDLQFRTFGTMTADLEALRDWLQAEGIPDVVMESTGCYWKPVWNLLEAHFPLTLANTREVHMLPGRKSDRQDPEWLARLHRCGLIRGCFVPSREQRELQELSRYRTRLIQARATQFNRIAKTLEGANSKLASVVSRVRTVSSRLILARLAQGVTDPEELAGCAVGRVRAKRPALERALAGSWGAAQQFLLREQLHLLNQLDLRLEVLSEEISRRLAPHQALLRLLETAPGVGPRGAEVLVAELGTDGSRFATAEKLAEFAGVCPGQNQSGSKTGSRAIRKANPWLRSVLVEMARAAARKRDSYPEAQYRRLAGRRGANRAAVAVAHSLLKALYYMVQRGTEYADLGGNYYEERDRSGIKRRLVNRLEQLGYDVTLTPVDPVAAAA